MGTVHVPASKFVCLVRGLVSQPLTPRRYYGAQTARSLINFSIGKDVMPTSIIRAFGILKQVAAAAIRNPSIFIATFAGRG